MPAVVPFIPLIAAVVGGAGADIATNAQNKAAQKNNANAQASAIANADTANKTAAKNLSTFNAANPAPDPTVAGPPGAANPMPVAGGGNAQHTAAANAALIQKMLRGQNSANPNAAAPIPNVSPLSIMQNAGQ